LKRLKVAVIGAGHLGRIHAKLLSAMPDVELVGVADPVAAARQQVAHDCGSLPFAEHRALIGQVEAAVIATPTRLHHEIGMEFLRRGIHVLMEKPLALTRQQADELVNAARRQGAILQVGHVERFNPALQAALPHLGGARYIEAVRSGSFSFRSTDIGVVLDLMIHDLDVVLSLVRSAVKSTLALGLSVLGRHEDVAHARLEFENGCVANLSASRVSPTARREMQVWTDYGFCSVDFAARKASVMRPSDALLRGELDVEELSAEAKTKLQQSLPAEHLRPEPLVVEERNAIVDEQFDFVRSIRSKRAPRVDGEQGRAALALAERILEQIAEHRWDGRSDGPIGPHARPARPILRGPHWQQQFDPTLHRREAG
jgi:predicted dehydrogenase